MCIPRKLLCMNTPRKKGAQLTLFEFCTELDFNLPPGFGMPIANPLFKAQNTDGDELGPPHLEARQQGNLIPPPPFLSEIGCLGKLSRQLLLPLLPLKQILDLGQNWKATGEGPRHSYVSSEHISSSPRSFFREIHIRRAH